MNRWCYPTVSFFATLFSFCLQSLLASGSFPNRWLFVPGGQICTRWSFSISPSNEYSGLISFKINWFDLLAVQGTLRVFSCTTVHTIHGVLEARILKWFAIPFSSGPHSVWLSTMTHPSWVALRAWLSFIELDKAVISLISFLWLWFAFCLPSHW